MSNLMKGELLVNGSLQVYFAPRKARDDAGICRVLTPYPLIGTLAMAIQLGALFNQKLQ